MHILIDGTAANTGEGGIVTYLANLLRTLPRLQPSLRLTVVATKRIAKSVAVAIPSDARVLELPWTGQMGRAMIQQLLMPIIARRSGADVLFCPAHVCPLVPLGVPTVVAMLDLRYVHRPTDFPWLQRRYRSLMYSQSAKRASEVICISEVTRQDVARTLTGSREMNVVYLGADHVLDWRRITSSDLHAVAFAGSPHKNALRVVRVWRMLRERVQAFGVRLAIIGSSGADRRALECEANRVGVADLVDIYGYLDQDSLQSLFASATLLVFPSLLEGFGLPVLEAMMLRIPVVCSDIPVLHEVGGISAIYVDPLSDESLVEGCYLALENGLKRQALVDGAFDWARRFTWERTSAETLEVFQNAVYSQARRN